MPKYLVRAKLTAEGIKGTLNEGGTARRAAIQRAAESIGGRLEAFNYAFGDDDVYAIFDAPDNVSVATLSMTVSASGIATSSVVVLITPEEMDEVAKKRPEYTPPRT